MADDGEKLELLGVESAEPEWALPALEALAGQVYRLRVVGSIAITAAYVAAGRFDAMAQPAPLPLGRRRRGPADRPRGRGAGELWRSRSGAGPLDLDSRYPIVAAAGAQGLATAAQRPVTER